MYLAVQKILFLVSFTMLYIGKSTICSLDYRLVNFSQRNRDDSSDGRRQLTWYIPIQPNNRNNFSSQNYHYNFTIRQATKANASPWFSYTLKNNNKTSVAQDRRIGENADIAGSENVQHRSSTNSNSGDGIEFHTRLNSDFSAKRKSEIKCEEYGEGVVKKVWALPLVGTNPEGILIPIKRGKCEGLHTPLIVGGTKVHSGEFPHMAALGWSNGGKLEYSCGGSLISDRWILTAAHCTHSPSGSPSVVRLGAHILSNTAVGRLIGIKKIYRHPKYRPPAMYADIALLELEIPVIFTDKIRPACLYSEYDASPAQTWATGWGATETGGDRSDVLLKARLDILDNFTCIRRYNGSTLVPRGIVPSMICAGDLTNDWTSDTCQADSGGPLQVIHPTISCLYQLVGITSFGMLCAVRDIPGIYTRVSHYLNWIEETVWPEAA